MKTEMKEITLRFNQYQSCFKQNPRMYHIIQQMNIPKNDPVALALCCVFAPSLGAFVQWLLLEALKDGRKRLYFLARDGYFMYRAALIFCEKLHLPIECRYLSCSRYSVRIPIFHFDQEDALDYICRGGIDVTLEKILTRAGLNRKEQSEVFSSLCLGFPKDSPIPYAMLPDIRKKLSRCSLFLQYMNFHSKNAFPDFAGYLRQEGLLDKTAYAIVDSGWVGSMQKTLDTALHFLGRENRLEGYYWGLYELPANADSSLYHCYYFEPEHHLNRKVFFNNCLFETVFTAPHGMTLSYRFQDGRYLPNYDLISKDRKQFLLKTERYLMQYIHLLARESQKSGFYRELLKNDLFTIEKLLKQFMTWPSYQEAEQFGTLSFSDDVLDSKDKVLAPLLSLKELRSNHAVRKLSAMLFSKKSVFVESAWYEGSVVRSCKAISSHLIQYTFYKYIRYLRKVYHFKKNRQVKKEND